MAIMSLRAYARHRGVELSAVQKAIKTGRISTQQDGRIDSEQADVEWEQNTRRRAQPVGNRKQEDDDVPIFSASQYTKVRTVREHYQALLAKIEYEERTGKLVRKDEVHVAAFNTFRQFRDRMLNIPDRVAAVFAAETDTAKCHEILVTEIRRALNDFADANG
jgi:pyruvate/2-oxoglutarate dehydrogenase complex dihydrolipoamide acyltransferase (E2) component